MVSMLRSDSGPWGKLTLEADLDFGSIEMSGVVYRNSLGLLKTLEADDITNPVPADNEMVIERVCNSRGELIGQVGMTYLQKVEIWDSLTQKQKELQARPVKPNQRVTHEINGVEYTGAIPGQSYAAKATAKNVNRMTRNNQFMVKNGFRKPKNRK